MKTGTNDELRMTNGGRGWVWLMVGIGVVCLIGMGAWATLVWGLSLHGTKEIWFGSNDGNTTAEFTARSLTGTGLQVRDGEAHELIRLEDLGTTGRLVLSPSSTAGAGLRVPAGTAPTSPVNGDAWGTTAGWYYRANGATQGPFLDAAGAGGLYQPVDATLTALAGAGAANTFPYFTSTDVLGNGSITAAGLAILDDANAAAQCATLGLGTGNDVSFKSATVSTNAYPAISSTVTGTGTNAVVPVSRVLALTTANMVDEFGPKLQFEATDNGASNKVFGGIGAVRDSADTEGKLVLYAGTNGIEPFAAIDHTGSVTVSGSTGNPNNVSLAGSDAHLFVGDAYIHAQYNQGSVYFLNDHINAPNHINCMIEVTTDDTEQMYFWFGSQANPTYRWYPTYAQFNVGLNVGSSASGADDNELCVGIADAGAYSLQGATLYTSGAATHGGVLSTSTVTTFTADDTSPSVSAGNIFKVPGTWTSGHNITTFDDGVSGQTIVVIGGDSDCVVVNGSNLKLESNWTGASGYCLPLTFDGTNWNEISARGARTITSSWNMAAPPAIGGTTPAAVKGTTVEATGIATLPSTSNAVVIGTSCTMTAPPPIGATTPNNVYSNAFYVRDDATVSGELITNGSMEVNANWTTLGSPVACAQTNAQAHGGTFSWIVQSDAQYEGIYQELAATYAPGTRFAWDVWVYGSAGEYIRIDMCTPAGSAFYSEVDLLAAGWNHFTGHAMPTTATLCRFRVMSYTASMIFYVDDASVKTVGGNGLVNGTLGVGGASTFVGNGYFVGDCSALTFTDRSEWPEDKDPLTTIAAIKGKNGKLDHETLPEFTRRQIKRTAPVTDENGEPTGETKEIVEEGRDLGAMVSMLTVAVKQLKEQNEDLQKQVAELKKPK